MTSQFDLTRFYAVMICNLVFQLGFLTQEFQIPYKRAFVTFAIQHSNTCFEKTSENLNVAKENWRQEQNLANSKSTTRSSRSSYRAGYYDDIF